MVAAGARHLASFGNRRSRGEERSMKYVVTWVPRANLTEEASARSLQVFGKWTPAGSFTEFLGRVDGQGGFAVVEADDPAVIAKDVAPFVAWFEFAVHPVLEIADSAAIDTEAVAFLASVT
jgi:hypothetical protein